MFVSLRFRGTDVYFCAQSLYIASVRSQNFAVTTTGALLDDGDVITMMTVEMDLMRETVVSNSSRYCSSCSGSSSSTSNSSLLLLLVLLLLLLQSQLLLQESGLRHCMTSKTL